MVEREYGLTAARSSPNPVLKIRAVFPVTLVIKPDAPIVPNQFLKRSVHRARFPDFANDLQRHRMVLMQGVQYSPPFVWVAGTLLLFPFDYSACTDRSDPSSEDDYVPSICIAIGF